MGKWDMVRLGDYVNQIRGVSYKPEDSSETPINTHVPVLRAQNIQDDGLNSTAMIFIDKKKIKPNQYIKKGDIVICASSGSKDLVGKAAQAKENMTASFGAFCKVVRHKDTIESTFLSHYFSSPPYRKRISELSAGANINNLRNEHIDELQIPLPPLPIQQQIADVLDRANALIEKRKAQIAKLDLLVKSQFIEMFGDPVSNPKGWEIHNLGDCCITNPSKSEISNLSKDTIVSFVGMADISGTGAIDATHTTDIATSKSGFTYFAEGDVIFAKITPCMENGKGAIARHLINGIAFGSTEFHVLRPIQGISNSEWIYYLTWLDLFRKQAEMNMTGSAGQKRVPIQFIKKMLIPLPPYPLQTQFAAFVGCIETQKSLLQQSLAKLEQNYKSLMQKCFRGEIF